MVCGGGHGGQVATCLFTAQGYKVTALSMGGGQKWADTVKEAGGMSCHFDLTGKVVGPVVPHLITADPSAVQDCDVVFLIAPAPYHEQYFKQLKPHVREGTLFAVMPTGPGCDMLFKNAMGEKADKVGLVAFEVLPWACRVKEWGKTSNMLGTKESMGFAMMLANGMSNDECSSKMQAFFPTTIMQQHPSITSISLSSPGQIIHPGVMYGRWQNWDGQPMEEAPLLYEGICDFTAGVMEGISAEIMQIDKCLCSLPHLDKRERQTSVKSLMELYVSCYKSTIADASTLRAAFNTNAPFKGAIHPMKEVEGGKVPDFQQRYMSEDVPNLCFSKGLAELLGVKTPIMDKVIYWCQDKLKKEFLTKDGRMLGADVKESRAPQAFGVTTQEELYEFLGVDMTLVNLVKKPESLFSDVAEAAPDPILNTVTLFQQDTCEDKINVGVGAYRTQEGKPYTLPVVKAAETQIYNDMLNDQIDKEYSSVDGPSLLKTTTQKLVFGDSCKGISEERIASVQTLSGTGALRLCGDFIKKHLPEASHTIWISNPTWGNHPTIFDASRMMVKRYRYWNEASKNLDFEGMMDDLKTAEAGNCVLLHACAHNPTGIDPTETQWKEILDLCIKKSLIVIMDSAYQGFASGDLDKDAYSIRLFENAGLELFVCQSFSKNLGLYGERIGMAHVVCKDETVASHVLSQLKVLIRNTYSSPAIHGAQLVCKILGNDAFLAQWKQELKEMAHRIHLVRTNLRKGLEAKGTPGTWHHVTDQIGMFSYTGLTVAQCERLINEHHIYLLKSGRISLAGLNQNNIQHMIDSIDEVVKTWYSWEGPDEAEATGLAGANGGA